MPEFSGYAHVAITVTDHAKSLPFYEIVFETKPVGEIVTDDFDRKIFPAGGGQIFGVTEYTQKKAGRFDPLVPGLDHVSFAVPSGSDVVRIQNRLADAGIPGDLVEVDYGTVLNIKDPDGNAIEFFAAPDLTD
ncbi:catechol 2,3-dioxygenase-like lactoylglutathione lyase family enzyme [Frondihabitans sp. PhB188]|uniref:VOC family protein n=1 Tax=Frondihabitans sp. PhB188 TaxID=2485200 RepID=UPI000F47F0EF|nr:VOC family protein [Frondihabitans sp. PhB188]ROQ38237.1 catechol 2,3-dioxygenase-like lactoylglutathione lyase family enzyme [Frondihabitans sp. PhB188]